MDKNFFNWNTNRILIKTNFAIDITNIKIYKKENLNIYQQLIEKLIYLIYKTKLNILFRISN